MRRKLWKVIATGLLALILAAGYVADQANGLAHQAGQQIAEDPGSGGNGGGG